MSLDDIRARERKASIGPWFAVRYYVGAGDDKGDPDAEIATAGCKPDAEFIAHARTDIPRLLAALDAVHELHFRMPGGSCAGCFTAYGEREEEWPCDTVQSITGALG